MHHVFILFLFFAGVFMLPMRIPFQGKEVDDQDLYMTIVEHYENRVDSVVSSETEDLLIDLIHMPKKMQRKTMRKQGNAFGIKQMSYAQMTKMPAIIGKHIHLMNAEIYESVEPTISKYWYNFQKKPSLTELDGMLAQALLETIDTYDLLGKIRKETLACKSRTFDWKQQILNLLFTEPTTGKDQALKFNFLRKHVSNIKSSLLLDFQLQFTDFYQQIQNEQYYFK